jgi:hypothetical protein
MPCDREVQTRARLDSLDSANYIFLGLSALCPEMMTGSIGIPLRRGVGPEVILCAYALVLPSFPSLHSDQCLLTVDRLCRDL